MGLKFRFFDFFFRLVSRPSRTLSSKISSSSLLRKEMRRLSLSKRTKRCPSQKQIEVTVISTPKLKIQFRFGKLLFIKGSLAEWSKALVLGTSPKGRGFEMIT